MVIPDSADRGPTNCIGRKCPMVHSIPNITDHNMVGNKMIDTSVGVSLISFLISLNNFLL